MPQKQQSKSESMKGRARGGAKSGSAGTKSAGRGTTKSGSSVAMSPLSDLEFDLISVMYQKGKALEAYDEYLEDAQASPEIRQVLERIRQDDAEHVRMLRQHFENAILGDGQSSRGEEIHA